MYVLLMLYGLTMLNAGELNFHSMKAKYMADRDNYKKNGTIKVPSGKLFYWRDIFELPEKKQKKAWEKFVNDAWKNAGSIIEKEGKIFKEGMDRASGKKKHNSKYSDYIRSPKEIEQYIEDSRKSSIEKYKRECTNRYC